MKPTTVAVPAALLLDRHLATTAKYLWAICQLGARTDHVTEVASSSGLSRTTVRRGLAQLETAGWLAAHPQGVHVGTPPASQTAHLLVQSQVTNLPDGPPHTASLPSDLLLDQRIGVQAKLLYGSLQLTPGFEGSTGQTTYAALEAQLGLTNKPLRAAAAELHRYGWLRIDQPNQLRPVHFTLRNPTADLREADVLAAEQRLTEARYYGESLMREYLSLLIESDQFEDNATPGFLINPYTDEEMQFDRYYPPGVAFEFNGPQHYGTTALYAKEMEVRRQQARDLLKTGICAQRGIILVVVHAEDLSLEGMRRKVPDVLPIRNLEGHERLQAFLENAGRVYRRQTRKHRGSMQSESS